MRKKSAPAYLCIQKIQELKPERGKEQALQKKFFKTSQNTA